MPAVAGIIKSTHILPSKKNWYKVYTFYISIQKINDFASSLQRKTDYFDSIICKYNKILAVPNKHAPK